MDANAIAAVRAGKHGVHVVTNLGAPMEALRVTTDHLGATWIDCRHFDGSSAGWWRADTLRALERTYVE